MLAAQSSALVQMGFRDVLHAQAAGTELVPITMHRHVSGTWTLTGGDGGTLDRFIYRSFTLTLWERTEPSGPQSWTRRLVIDDDDLNLLNGDESYPFEVLPGKDLILSIYAYGQGSCIGDTTFGDPSVLYHDCYAFMDFGGQFGDPISFEFEPGPGVTLTADSGFTGYVPEPSAPWLAEASLFALVGLRRAALLEHRALQLREHLRHLGEQVVAVGARASRGRWRRPSARRGRRARRAQPGIGRDLGVPVRIEEEREREPVAARGVADAMRRRAIAARRSCGRACRRGCRRTSRGSAARRSSRSRDLHLQAAGVVLQQDREHAVVGVLADAPGRIGVAARDLRDS